METRSSGEPRSPTVVDQDKLDEFLTSLSALERRIHGVLSWEPHERFRDKSTKGRPGAAALRLPHIYLATNLPKAGRVFTPAPVVAKPLHRSTRSVSNGSVVMLHEPHMPPPVPETSFIDVVEPSEDQSFEY